MSLLARITVSQQKELLRCLDNHVQAPIRKKLRWFIEKAIENKLSLQQVHTHIRSELSRPSARGSFLSRLFTKKEVYHNNLEDSLISLIAMQAKAAEHRYKITLYGNIPSPREQGIQPPESFRSDLFLTHVTYGDMDDYVTGKALVQVAKAYSIHYSGHKFSQDEVTTGFHTHRMNILKRWTTLEGYQSLISSIDTSLQGNSFSLILDESYCYKPSDGTQDFMNWLGVVSQNFYSPESAYGMCDILHILSLPAEEGKANHDALFLINTFHQRYLTVKCVAWLNIDAPLQKQLDHSINHLNNEMRTQDAEKITNALTVTLKNLIKLYNDVNFLMDNNIRLLEKELDKLSPDMGDPLANEYRNYLNAALNFKKLYLQALSEKTTTLDFEPVEISPNIFYTPYKSNVFDCISPSTSMRLSNRTPESSSSKTPSNSGKLSSKSLTPSTESLITLSRRSSSNLSTSNKKISPDN